MTSKEKLERIENFIDGSPITKEYREKLNTNVKEIKKDLEEKEKQDKILSILKNKKVDIKLVLWAGQKVEAYNVVVREKNLFPREELTQEEFDLLREAFEK